MKMMEKVVMSPSVHFQKMEMASLEPMQHRKSSQDLPRLPNISVEISSTIILKHEANLSLQNSQRKDSYAQSNVKIDCKV